MEQKKKRGFGKIILIILGVLFVIGLIGSKFDKSSNEQIRDGSTENAISQTSQNISENNTEFKKIGDEIEVGNFSYRVNGTQYTKTVGNEFTQTTADGIFLIVNVTFRNNDNEEHTLDNSFFKLTDEKGTEFESSTEGETALEMSGQTTLFLKQCNPQITKSGLLIFEVPDRKVYNLHLSGGYWSGKTAVVQLTTN